MGIGNSNLFVTKSKCGMQEKKMGREPWIILFPPLTRLEPLDKPFKSFYLCEESKCFAISVCNIV